MATWGRKFRRIAVDFNDDGDILYVGAAYEDTATSDVSAKTISEDKRLRKVWDDLGAAAQANVYDFVSDVKGAVENDDSLPSE